MSKKTQKQLVKEHLQSHGYMSRVIAYNVYGIIDLRKIISLLRAEGMVIDTGKSTDDNGRTYTKYLHHGVHTQAA